MNTSLKLSVQEHLLPDDTLIAKFKTAKALGFDAIELRAKDDFKNRQTELIEAVKAGVEISSVCPDTTLFFTDFDADNRRAAIENLKSWMATVVKATGTNTGVITPASWGLFSRALPPHVPPRSEADDQQVLQEGLEELAAYAEEVGVRLFLEPLNRYEDYLINTIEQAAAWCERIHSPALSILADTYHMNIAEQSLSEPLIKYKKWISHVHLSDSNRAQPGAGHLDFQAVLHTLKSINFSGYMTIECKLIGKPEEALRQAATFLKAQIMQI